MVPIPRDLTVFRNLNRTEERCLLALMECNTVTAAATHAKLHRRTVERIMARPHVKQAYRNLRAEILKGLARRLRGMSSKALDTLEDALASDGMERVTAARAILDYSIRMNEREEIVDRLEDLERTRDLAPRATAALPAATQQRADDVDDGGE